LLSETLTLPLDALIASEVHLLFLSEIYNLNFLVYKTTMPDKAFKSLLLSCRTFEKVTFGKNADTHRFSYKINNILNSFKISLSELLFQLSIMFRFNNFNFDWFADYRLRIYYLGRHKSKFTVCS
jgi:hypothetical protein